MEECKHDLGLLVGVADGVLCRGCGKVFKSVEEALQETAEPKKVVKKRGRKVDA